MLTDKVLSKRVEIFCSVFLGVLFAVGLLGHVYGFERQMIQTTELFIFVCNTIVTGMLLWTSFSRTGKVNYSLLVWIVAFSVITLGIEIYGVATGAIFGSYHYGSTFSWKILGVPWIIGWNWVLITLACTLIIRDLMNYLTVAYIKPLLYVFIRYDTRWDVWYELISNFVIALGTGLIAAGFDYILEPVAGKYDYWHWAGNIIPLQNYLAWFAISFVISLILARFKVAFSSRLLKDYFFLQTVFFLGLLINMW